VKISDNGIGISESELHLLFKLGEKTGRKGTGGEPTTGLGLILCKEFIELHGGKIFAESKVGAGSKFSFTLPIS
jgi:signal transduction histidine kinase